MSHASMRHFGIFFDRYYWQSAILIAKNGLARQYRNSYLGMLWTLLQPLTMICVYSFVMPMIMRFPKNGDYLLYIIVSLPLWSFFSGTLTGSSNSILANGETLKRCMISSTVFPVADVLRNTYTFFISFLVMYGVDCLIQQSFHPITLLMPIFFIPVLMCIGSLAIAVAFVAPYVRDIGDFIQVCMNVLYWLTPVVYQASILPEWVQRAERFNPFYILMHPIHMVAYEHTLPGIDDIARLFVLTVLCIFVGFSIFRICRRNYVYYL